MAWRWHGLRVNPLGAELSGEALHGTHCEYLDCGHDADREYLDGIVSLLLISM